MTRRRWTKEKIIEALQAFVAENGRPPTREELTIENGLPIEKTCRYYFGSCGAAFKAAKLSDSPRERPTWTREKVIAAFKDYYAAHGELPKSNRVKGFPTRSPIVRLFGSWNEAIRAAGFEPRPRGSQPGRVFRKPKPVKPLARFEGWGFDDRLGEKAELKEKPVKPPKRRRRE